MKYDPSVNSKPWRAHGPERALAHVENRQMKDERLPRAHTSSNMSFSFFHKNQHSHVETYICEFLITSSQKSVERQSQQGQSQQQRHTHMKDISFFFYD